MSEIDFDAIIRFSSKNYSNPEISRIFYIIDLRFLGEHHTGVLLTVRSSNPIVTCKQH